MRFEEITTQDALEIIARSALKNEYDKTGMIGNAGAYRDTVIRRALENEAAVPGTLKLAYQAAAKNLASEEPVKVNPEAYSPWSPPDDDYEVCTPEERARWLELIQKKLAGLDLSMNRPTLAADLDDKNREHVISEQSRFWTAAVQPRNDDDDIPGYGDAA